MNQPKPYRSLLQGLPDAQPHGLRRGRRRRRHRPDDSLDEHAYDTISGGDWLCDQDAVEAFVKEAPRGAAPAGALGLPVEPRAGRPRRRAAPSAA